MSHPQGITVKEVGDLAEDFFHGVASGEPAAVLPGYSAIPMHGFIHPKDRPFLWRTTDCFTRGGQPKSTCSAIFSSPPSRTIRRASERLGPCTGRPGTLKPIPQGRGLSRLSQEKIGSSRGARMANSVLFYIAPPFFICCRDRRQSCFDHAV